jgi:hypothetical protein
MLPPPELRTIVKSLALGSVSHSELSRAIHICRTIVESHLEHHRGSLVHICALNGLSVIDLATDCIGDIFARDDLGNFRHFQKFVESLNQPLDETSSKDLFLAFISFVLRFAKTQLARVYSQSDPTGARILRNIKDSLENSTCLTIGEDFRGYVVKPRAVDALDHRPSYPLTQIEAELFALKGAASSTPDLLDKIASILMEQEEYRRSIPLIDVVQVAKSLFERLAPSEASMDLGELDRTTEDLVEIKNSALGVVNEKIISTYLLKGKVSKSEAQILSQTMSSIISGWFEQGASDKSYYRHLAALDTISEQEYESFWRKKIEYLARIAREAIVLSLDGAI